ncbi:MAG TPA: hypothetical protein VF183_04750 [Acidimicrobiales bacterium]
MSFAWYTQTTHVLVATSESKVLSIVVTSSKPGEWHAVAVETTKPEARLSDAHAAVEAVLENHAHHQLAGSPFQDEAAVREAAETYAATWATLHAELARCECPEIAVRVDS